MMGNWIIYIYIYIYIYIDKTALDDVITFQDAQFEIIGGYYLNRSES